jgi:hypothetical protein
MQVHIYIHKQHYICLHTCKEKGILSASQPAQEYANIQLTFINHTNSNAHFHTKYSFLHSARTGVRKHTTHVHKPYKFKRTFSHKVQLLALSLRRNTQTYNTHSQATHTHIYITHISRQSTASAPPPPHSLHTSTPTFFSTSLRTMCLSSFATTTTTTLRTPREDV